MTTDAGAKKNESQEHENDGLLPSQTRIMDNLSYLLAWLGGCVSIGTFAMGASLVGELNLVQATVAMMIGCSIIALGLVINGKAGHKYGIPFVIQARGAFGISGTKLPGLIRAIPAVVWFGFQSWVGAGALNECSRTLFGFDNMVFFFVTFQLLQIVLSVFGFEGIKWLENIGSVFIIASLIYMFYTVSTKYGAEIEQYIGGIKGTWGIPFWGGTTAFLGIYSTMMLNVSDYSRHLSLKTRPITTGGIYWLAILPATLFMGMIGLMISGATGSADPIASFSTAVDNKVLMISTLLFIAFAQVTTNVLNNVVPPALVLMDMLKISYKKASIFVGLAAFATFPWKLVQPESSAGLQLFVQTYSAFLGPIFAVLVVDYYILRKQTFKNIDVLYDTEGPLKGVNWAGVIAIGVGAAFAFVDVRLSWFASLIPAGVTYYMLMRHLPGSKRFREI